MCDDIDDDLLTTVPHSQGPTSASSTEARVPVPAPLPLITNAEEKKNEERGKSFLPATFFITPTPLDLTLSFSATLTDSSDTIRQQKRFSLFHG
jgi:hypothetical protein